jgi:hypothetical protein
MPDTHLAASNSVARLDVPAIGEEDASVRDLVAQLSTILVHELLQTGWEGSMTRRQGEIPKRT